MIIIFLSFPINITSIIPVNNKISTASKDIKTQLINKINDIINISDDKELIIICKQVLDDINNIYVLKIILQDVKSTDDILDLKYLINEYIAIYTN